MKRGIDVDYTVRLVARNEGLDYVDDQGIYHFDVQLRGRQWTVRLPATKGLTFEVCEMTAQEQAKILPRVERYLSRIKWFGIFPMSYNVRVVEEECEGHPVIGYVFPRYKPGLRVVITRDGTASYRVYLQQRDEDELKASGRLFWQIRDKSVADSWRRAQALASEMLPATPDKSSWSPVKRQ